MKQEIFKSDRIFAVIGALLVIFVSNYLANMKFVKAKMNELLAIDNWENTPYNKKGKRIFLFHLIFTFLPALIMLFISMILYNLTK